MPDTRDRPTLVMIKPVINIDAQIEMSMKKQIAGAQHG
jgi:hypothetical protein